MANYHIDLNRNNPTVGAMSTQACSRREHHSRKRDRRTPQEDYLYTLHYLQHDAKSAALRQQRALQRYKQQLSAWLRHEIDLTGENTDERRACRLDALLYAASKIRNHATNSGPMPRLQHMMLAHPDRNTQPFASTNYYHFMEIDLLAQTRTMSHKTNRRASVI